jgi:CRISPR-associated endoribonuclease Cas6
MQYHYRLQGFIYSLVEGSKYHYIHNKEGYKFFCFSNIFPAYDLKQGDIRHLIISSPDPDFIRQVSSKLREKRLSRSRISIGNMKFDIAEVKVLQIQLKVPFTAITGTPIIIRVPREKYVKFDIRTKKPYNYLYWRQEHPLEMFIEQLEDNLHKKYLEFTGLDIMDKPIIQKFTFKKQVSTRIFMKGLEQIVIGSIWEFWFNDNAYNEVLEFGIDCGFGERNSLGFGFINLKL